MSGILTQQPGPHFVDIAPISRSHSSNSSVQVGFHLWTGNAASYGLLVTTAQNDNPITYGPLRNPPDRLPSLHVRLRQLSFVGTAGIYLTDFTLNTWVPQFYPATGAHSVQIYTTSVGSSSVVYALDISLDGGVTVARTYSITLSVTRT